MEREKGFESAAIPALSGPYDIAHIDQQRSTRPLDASRQVATAPEEGDDPSRLPYPTAELFFTAGARLAAQAARENLERSRVEEILRRAIDQATALRGEAV